MRRTLALVFCLASGPMAAADEVVMDCDSDVELRGKLVAMQASGGGTLTFACGDEPTTIVLTGGALPTIATPTVVDGGGTVTLSGGNTTRHLGVDFFGSLTLRRLTLADGFTTGNGGAVIAIGGLSIERCVFRDNVAGELGGAIYGFGGTIVDSDFLRNRATGGGALAIEAGTVAVRRTRFIDNEAMSTYAVGSGGDAIRVSAGAQAELERVSATGLRGGADGALVHVTFDASATIVGGILRDYSSTGAAISVAGALAVSDSALLGDRALSAGDVSGLRLIAQSATATATNVTISGYRFGINNSLGSLGVAHATLVGNGIAVDQGAGIVAGTTFTAVVMADNGANCDSSEPSGPTGAFNLSDDSSCDLVLTGPSNRHGLDPQLGPLSDLGSTYGYVPAAGSPLRDTAATVDCPAADQRGVPRPVGDGCDVGAIERRATEPPSSLFVDGFE